MSAPSSTDPSSPSSTASQSRSQPELQAQSQTKCHTCRRRRVRCDFTRPACLKCTSQNTPCGGYSAQKPLVWLAGGGRQNEYIREEARVPKALRRERKKGRPRVEVMEDDENGGTQPARGNNNRSKEKGGKPESGTLGVRAKKAQKGVDVEPDDKNIHFPCPLDPNYSSDVKTKVNVLWYFNEKLFPDVDPFNYHGSFNSVNPKQWQCRLPDIVWCVLFTVVETHKAIQTHSHPHRPRGMTCSETDSRSVVRKEVYGYKSRAFRLLNEELRRPETQLNDWTLVYVLTLLMAEIQLSAVGDWYAHFQGALKIIQLRGGLGAVFKQNPFIDSNLKFFMISDVASAATDSIPLLSDAQRQLSYMPLIKEILHDGTGTCVPFPNEMFDAMIQVNYLRAVFSTSEKPDLESVRNVLQYILCFSTSQWATRMANHFATRGILDKNKIKPGFIRPTWDDWLRIGSVYHAAVLLYCIRSLALDFDELFRVPCPLPAAGPGLDTTEGEMTSCTNVQDIQLIARQTLTNHLHAIFFPPRSPANSRPNINRAPTQQVLGKIFAWPLFVAGVEAAVDTSSFDPPSPYYSSSPNEKLDLVCNSLCKLSRDIGTLNLLDLVTFLMREWEGNCEKWWVARQLEQEIDTVCGIRWWSDIMAAWEGKAAVFM